MSTSSGDEHLEEHVIAVREGHGANCSSIGSVIDTLFLSAVAGGVLLTVVLAALKKEQEKKE